MTFYTAPYAYELAPFLGPLVKRIFFLAVAAILSPQRREESLMKQN
jgi:hypothetical protein